MRCDTRQSNEKYSLLVPRLLPLHEDDATSGTCDPCKEAESNDAGDLEESAGFVGVPFFEGTSAQDVRELGSHDGRRQGGK